MLVGAVCMGASICGCPTTNLLVDRPHLDDVSDQMTSCPVAKDPLNPMIIEWPATDKMQLQGKSDEGVVVVSYVGCHLKVLKSCRAGGSYSLSTHQPARDVMHMTNESELNARLPVGFVSLKGRLAGGNSLELDYAAVGERKSDGPPDKLEGGCEGATHYVRAMTLGAYVLDAVGRGEASLGVDVQGIGGDAGRKEARSQLNHSGDPQRCFDAGKMSQEELDANQCNAILQLSLEPLRRAASGGTTTAGFGAGLGPVAGLPGAPEVVALSMPVMGDTFQGADVELLKKVQLAKRADRNRALGPREKSSAWLRVVSAAPEGAMQRAARERAEAWWKLAIAKREREARAAKSGRRYAADKQKLADLLSLDEDVVSREQKAAYVREFDTAYTPYAELLAADELRVAHETALALADGTSVIVVDGEDDGGPSVIILDRGAPADSQPPDDSEPVIIVLPDTSDAPIEPPGSADADDIY